MNSKDLVLILTESSEISIGHVIPWLNHFGQKFVRINTNNFINEERHLSLLLKGQNLFCFIGEGNHLILYLPPNFGQYGKIEK